MKVLAMPKGMLSAAQKKAATDKGLFIIECEDPDKIRIIDTETMIDVNDLFMAALHGLTVNTPTSKAENFVNNLYKRLKEKETKPVPPPINNYTV